MTFASSSTGDDARQPWQGRNGPLMIAEIGGNHEGDFDYARRLTDLAIESGADCIKFQIYTGDTLVSPVESPDRNAHFRRFELSPEQHVALARQCREAGVGYAASVWDLSALDWIDEYLDFYKIGSGDLTAYPVIAEFARRGKPIVLSTGLSTAAEVVETVEFLRKVNSVYAGDSNLAVLQCTSMYPCVEEDVHLAAMNELGRLTGAAIGYSDHTCGTLALLAAAARGAQVLEFHFTDGREGKTFRDHKVSLTRDEVREFASRVARVRTLLGNEHKAPTRSEVESGHVESFRRALYCNRDLAAGEQIRGEDLVALRPNRGVDARSHDAVVGRVAKYDTEALSSLALDNFLIEDDEQ
ncbi:MAG: N-acetylneuraminate synthase [Xanthomonadales bacterium]|nr:N-acetylneuraminate synthase [Xanthomonadales bacterium]